MLEISTQNIKNKNDDLWLFRWYIVCTQKNSCPNYENGKTSMYIWHGLHWLGSFGLQSDTTDHIHTDTSCPLGLCYAAAYQHPK